MSSKVAIGVSAAALSLMTVSESLGYHQILDQSDGCSWRSNSTSAVQRKPWPVADKKPCADAERVLRSFNTWAFKREQPSDSALMLRFIGEAIAAREPVPFVLYWGKGPRHEAALPDVQCLDFLAAMAARVASAYGPGAAFKLILTDTHAELNGHSRADICRYYEAIEVLAKARGIAACWLGQIARAARAFGIEASTVPEQPAPPEVLASLVGSAAKWYRGTETVEAGAAKYFRMNMHERLVVQATFPRSIFVTFNGSSLRSLFPPQLPIFYMYSLRRGFSVKPWFLSAEPTAPSLAANPEKTLLPV
jgi:L-tyrosine isonitrile synthase